MHILGPLNVTHHISTDLGLLSLNSSVLWRCPFLHLRILLITAWIPA